ncbi:MAG: IS30 family transposase [Flavobacteriales bacterium]|nr:IS30 family transposase [Flavobacteriales bacterium]
MKHLTLEQRYVISILHKRGFSKVEIATEIGVDRSTIYRELQRNSSKRNSYNPKKAHEYYSERKERFCYSRKFTKEVEKKVISYLTKEQWSPEQIVGYCRKHQINMVSIERIYQFIRLDKNNGGSLYKELRHQLKNRKRPVGEHKIKIKDRISIDKRPKRINNREEFGHFEMDLIVGKNHKGVILTLTERVSKFFIIKYLPKGKTAIEVAKTVNDLLFPYKDFVHSITTDNGLEFAEHKKITKKLGVTIYFTNPYCSWEKGQIENMNKLLRQYIPKNQEINENNTRNLNEIQMKINNRPRKNLNFDKPVKLFSDYINHNVAFAS